VSLTYAHVERFVVGGAMPLAAPVMLPVQDGGAP
jgi:5-keto 4-deoxyuronate isomerase